MRGSRRAGHGPVLMAQREQNIDLRVPLGDVQHVGKRQNQRRHPAWQVSAGRSDRQLRSERCALWRIEVSDAASARVGRRGEKGEEGARGRNAHRDLPATHGSVAHLHRAAWPTPRGHLEADEASVRSLHLVRLPLERVGRQDHRRRLRRRRRLRVVLRVLRVLRLLQLLLLQLLLQGGLLQSRGVLLLRHVLLHCDWRGEQRVPSKTQTEQRMNAAGKSRPTQIHLIQTGCGALVWESRGQHADMTLEGLGRGPWPDVREGKSEEAFDGSRGPKRRTADDQGKFSQHRIGTAGASPQ
ncbi:unnamed protein product [Prorocentrum cordatum]|uniref:Uncharacterized protein n=1 Tax=Prorocentrum cordatum TaxID=2364126 RepID=A0ABN9UBI4_9DINO|nr:unnamed protein product [Polarella glacialis]